MNAATALCRCGAARVQIGAQKTCRTVGAAGRLRQASAGFGAAGRLRHSCTRDQIIGPASDGDRSRSSDEAPRNRFSTTDVRLPAPDRVVQWACSAQLGAEASEHRCRTAGSALKSLLRLQLIDAGW